MQINSSRSSNLEFFRIITMLIIVGHHYVMNSGLLNVMEANYAATASLFYYLFGMWGKTGINCFVMITGYFMCRSQITLRKFIKLYFEVVFYSLIILIIFTLSGKVDFSAKDLIFAFLPFRNVISDSFVHAFIVWWLFIPFLNILVHNMTQREHLWLTILCVIVFSVYDKMPITKIDVNPICWFSTIYLVASYIRFYPKCIYKSENAQIWGLCTLIIILLSMLSVVSIHYIYNLQGKTILPYALVSDSNAPFALLTAIASFLFFKNLKVKHSSFINAVGATTFGVLLIHANSATMRSWLWGSVVGCIDHFSIPFYWLYAIGATLTIFAVCSSIDYLRIRILERPFMKWVDKRISNSHK